MAIFFIILIIIIPMILIALSTLRIDIKEFEAINKKVTKFNLVISLNLFKKIKWIKLKINNQNVSKLKYNYKLKFINKILDTKILKKYKGINKILTTDLKLVLNQLQKFEIESFNLKAELGTVNPARTAYIVAIISSILAIVLARKINTPKYSIQPIYENRNHIYLSINCIIAIKLVHIINMNKQIKGKEVYQANGRTSNRRAYANSNG